MAGAAVLHVTLGCHARFSGLKKGPPELFRRASSDASVGLAAVDHHQELKVDSDEGGAAHCHVTLPTPAPLPGAP